MAGAATAGSLTDEILRQLRMQGYGKFRVSRTWLGRTRILAFRGGSQREIVVNPRTGEILRDVFHGKGDGLIDPGADHDDDDHHGNEDDGESGGEDSGDSDGDGDGDGDGAGDGDGDGEGGGEGDGDGGDD